MQMLARAPLAANASPGRSLLARAWWRILVCLLLCFCLAPNRPPTPERVAYGGSTPDLRLAPATHPQPTDLAALASSDPVAMLEACIRRYQSEVRGYTCILEKRERINGELREPEVIAVAFREHPFSVLMRWKQNPGRALATLYVAGEHNDRVLIVPSNSTARVALRFGKGYVTRSPDSPEVREASRYSVHEFGIYKGTERTYLAWKSAKERGVLRTEYLGVREVPEAGGRPCHIVRRLCDPPEEEGLTEVTIAIDAETWLQVGSVLKAKDELIGSYYFRDIKLNPAFDANQFKPEALKGQ